MANAINVPKTTGLTDVSNRMCQQAARMTSRFKSNPSLQPGLPEPNMLGIIPLGIIPSSALLFLGGTI